MGVSLDPPLRSPSESHRLCPIAVQEQDFSDFHRFELAKQFKEKYPVAKFAAIFKEFLNERANLKWVEGIDPVFDTAPTLNTDGILQAVGSFPSTPLVNFRYAFVQEDAIWKMIMININVPPQDEVTDEANSKAVAKNDVLN